MIKETTFILAIIISCQMSCKDSDLQLTLSCEKTSEFRNRDTVEFIAQLKNTSSKTLFIYRFCNPIGEIYSLSYPDWKLESCDESESSLGLNIVITDSAGALKGNQYLAVEIFDLSDKISEYEISLLDRVDITEIKKQTQLTKTKIDPGQVMRAKLFLDLSEYDLDPGVYSLTLIYDAAKSKIGFVEFDSDNFIGCVSSNSIKIIVI